jgi:hypothetical protein
MKTMKTIKTMSAAVGAMMLMWGGTAMTATTATQTQEISGNVASAITLAIDSAVNDNTGADSYVAGVEEVVQATLTINSTAVYTVKASNDAATTEKLAADEQKMFEWNGTAYVASGSKITDVPQVVRSGGTAVGTAAAVADITTAGTLVFMGTIDTGDVADDLVVDFKFTPSLGQKKLAGSNVYRMLVTYTAATTA